MTLYFGGKRDVAEYVWRRLGQPRQYIEPFCGSAAMLLAAPAPASLEVIGDASGFVANFWRAVVHQPGEVARWADYPVSHVDLGARHVWLMQHREALAELQDPEWPGHAQIAGWWLWGQCAWIGSGWCEWEGKIPHVANAGRGVQAIGKIPHINNTGRGVQAIGKVPHVGDAGRGPDTLWTSGGRTAWRWLHELAARMERVRVVHGDWSRCLNHHYGADDTAVFLDPPYDGRGEVYGATALSAEVAAWATENAGLRIALCGLTGEHAMPGWSAYAWERSRLTYAGAQTKADEVIWFSPSCLPAEDRQASLFGDTQ